MSFLEQYTESLPVVFLSYMEPNAEQNFQDLQEYGPRILIRVDGVRGFDLAHKTASLRAIEKCPNSPLFITVDADNQVLTDFWKIRLDQVADAAQVDLTESVISFRAINHLNGACYGNGGLKIWSHKFAQQMQTHEQTDGKVIDFCWDRNYIQMKNVMSKTFPNGNALQAFRSGYREGVKLLKANDEAEVTARTYARRDWNAVCLHQWVLLGSHEVFGCWANLGTMLAVQHLHEQPDLVLRRIIDYDAFKNFFDDFVFERSLNTSEAFLTKGSTLQHLTEQTAKDLIKKGLIESGPLNGTRSRLLRLMMKHEQSYTLLQRE